MARSATTARRGKAASMIDSASASLAAPATGAITAPVADVEVQVWADDLPAVDLDGREDRHLRDAQPGGLDPRAVVGHRLGVRVARGTPLSNSSPGAMNGR